MTTYTWSGTGTASWGTAADWTDQSDNTTGALPTDLDTALINAPGATVTVGTQVLASAYILDTAGATLAVSGGTLTTEHAANFNGRVSVTAGTYTAGGTGAVFNQALTQTGGTIDAVTGTLAINDGSTLSGTLSGAGVLDFAGANTNNYIGTGFVCKLSSVEVTGGAKLGLEKNFAFAHNLTVNNSTLDLFGHVLTDTGAFALSGVAGSGTIQAAGTLTLGTNTSTETLDNGLMLAVTGTVIQADTVYLGANDSGADVNIGKAGQYDINGNWSVGDPSSIGSISNLGVFAKTGGGKLTQIDTQFSSSGTIAANIGELQLDGLINAVSGTVSGAGTFGIGTVGGYGQTTFAPELALSVANVHQASGILVLNAAQSYTGNWNMSGGVLNLNKAAAVLTLKGDSSFDAGTLSGYSGSLVLDGPTELGAVTIGGPDTIDVNGTLTQTGLVLLGLSSNPDVTIAAGADWLIDADSSILGSYGLIDNAGVFWDRNGSSTSTIQSQIVNTGTLIADSTLQLDSSFSTLGGTLSGGGLLDVAGGTTTLASGLSITVAALDISSDVVLAGNQTDAKAVSQYTGTLDLSAHSFALSGTASLDGGTLSDGGTLTASGQTTIGNYTVTAGAGLVIAGSGDQSGALQLADQNGTGTLVVAASGAYNVLDNFTIGGAGALVIDGKLTESGTGLGEIDASLTLAAAGLLTANDQTLTLTNVASLAGTLAGTGAVALSGGTFSLAAGLALASGTLELTGAASATLLANQSYAGDFRTSSGTLNLGADTFTLSGPALLGNNTILSGGGTLLAGGATTLLAPSVQGSATLAIAGAAQQLGNLAVGNPTGAASTATFAIMAGGTDTLDASASILGDGMLSVAASGTLIAGGNALSQISTAIVDQGTIAANQGDLQIIGSVSAASTGLFSIGGPAELDFLGGSTVGSATAVSFAAGGDGTLRIDDMKTFAATIENFATRDMIQISGLAGTLSASYANTAHTQLMLADSSGNSIVLAFSTAQTLSAIGLSDTSNVATLTHS